MLKRDTPGFVGQQPDPPPLSFWDYGGQTDPNRAGLMGGSLDCLLPDVSQENRLSSRWDWDVIYFNGSRVPGLCKLKVKREHRVDAVQAAGFDGVNLTSLGYGPAEVEVALRLWTPQQFDDFKKLTRPIIHPFLGKPQSRPAPFSVEHPALALWGIRNLFVRHFSGPEAEGSPQIMGIKLFCSEHQPMMNVGTKPLSSGMAGAKSVFDKKPGSQPPAAPPSSTANSPTTQGGK